MASLPAGVELVLAAKGRRPEEVLEAVGAGGAIVGENYVQEAEAVIGAIGGRARMHFIGHLQRNKVKMAVGLFDMIQTVDSVTIAREVDRRCAQIAKMMPVLVEVNSGREPQKSGVLPEDTPALVREVSLLTHVRVMGLMTMGPPATGVDDMRPYFASTRQVFDAIARAGLANVEMRYLSMGMSDSYLVAIAEGANMVRLGREVFGDR